MVLVRLLCQFQSQPLLQAPVKFVMFVLYKFVSVISIRLFVYSILVPRQIKHIHTLKKLSGLVCQKEVSSAGISNYIPQNLWDLITDPCPWYGGLCNNIIYPSKTHLKLKSREISFIHNIRFSCPIVLKFCTEHGSITAVSYIAQHPSSSHHPSYFTSTIITAGSQLNVNTLSPRANGHSITDGIFKCIFLCKRLYFDFNYTVPNGPINDKLVEIMTWRQAVTWTNDGLAHWHINASPALDSLRCARFRSVRLVTNTHCLMHEYFLLVGVYVWCQVYSNIWQLWLC